VGVMLIAQDCKLGCQILQYVAYW